MRIAPRPAPTMSSLVLAAALSFLAGGCGGGAPDGAPVAEDPGEAKARQENIADYYKKNPPAKGEKPLTNEQKIRQAYGKK